MTSPKAMLSSSEASPPSEESMAARQAQASTGPVYGSSPGNSKETTNSLPNSGSLHPNKVLTWLSLMMSIKLTVQLHHNLIFSKYYDLVYIQSLFIFLLYFLNNLITFLILNKNTLYLFYYYLIFINLCLSLNHHLKELSLSLQIKSK